MNKYDILVVGAGLFGAVIAQEAKSMGLRVLVIDKRNHIGGNCYTKHVDGINVHKYGAHIFRTSDKRIWRYMEQFCEFNNFINSPIANYNGELYNLPFNMNTFHELWGVTTPEEANEVIRSQQVLFDEPANLEEHVLSMVGRDIFEKLVRGYTEKQWGRQCNELPASIMKRIPLRFTFDNNYFRDPYQGIPIGGYTRVFEKMFCGVDVQLNVDYFNRREEFNRIARLIIFTGPIDAFYDYCYGSLDYRSLRFEEEILDIPNYQGVAVMNYTDEKTPYTRIIEHKHFEFGCQDFTVISREYPLKWQQGIEPYYPIEDEANRHRYQKYEQLAAGEDSVKFGGRLGEYRYYDMQDTIKSALEKSKLWLTELRA